MPELESRKTGGLTALGVTCVALGTVWIYTAAWAALQPETIRAQVARFGVPQLLTDFSVIVVYTDAAVNLLLAALLFAAGVGLLRLRKWGARLAVWYAIGRIGWSVVSTALTYMGPLTTRPPAGQMLPDQATFMAERFGPIAFTMLLAGFLLPVAFAVIILCLLSRKTYKDNLS